LKLADGVGRRRTKDAVNTSRVEAELGEEYLKFGDVVTAKRRTREIQQALAELPVRFFQSFPCREIHDTREGESARALKGLDECHGLGVEDVVTFVGGAERQGAQAFFEFANTRARGARA
jgi:hypothetical protein